MASTQIRVALFFLYLAGFSMCVYLMFSSISQAYLKMFIEDRVQTLKASVREGSCVKDGFALPSEGQLLHFADCQVSGGEFFAWDRSSALKTNYKHFEDILPKHGVKGTWLFSGLEVARGLGWNQWYLPEDPLAQCSYHCLSPTGNFEHAGSMAEVRLAAKNVKIGDHAAGDDVILSLPGANVPLTGAHGPGTVLGEWDVLANNSITSNNTYLGKDGKLYVNSIDPYGYSKSLANLRVSFQVGVTGSVSVLAGLGPHAALEPWQSVLALEPHGAIAFAMAGEVSASDMLDAYGASHLDATGGEWMIYMWIWPICAAVLSWWRTVFGQGQCSMCRVAQETFAITAGAPLFATLMLPVFFHYMLPGALFVLVLAASVSFVTLCCGVFEPDKPEFKSNDYVRMERCQEGPWEERSCFRVLLEGVAIGGALGSLSAFMVVYMGQAFAESELATN